MKTPKQKAESYFYKNVYNVDSSVDYEDENLKQAIIDAYKAGFKAGKK